MTVLWIVPEASAQATAESRLLSERATTLPKGRQALRLDLGWPLPVIWNLKYFYGMSDGVDLGLNGLFFAANGYILMGGLLGRVNLIHSPPLDVAFSLLADYFKSNIDFRVNAQAFLGHPSVDLTIAPEGENYLFLASLGSYLFWGNFGFSCFTLCDNTATAPNHFDAFIDPGVGFEISLAEHWDFFVKGYALINAENAKAGGGGYLGFAYIWN